MSSLCDIYFAIEQGRDQHTAYNPEQRTRFDAFGEIIDTPTVEGFAADEFQKAMNAHHAQMLAQKRCAVERVQRSAQDIEFARLARIRANAHFKATQSISKRPWA